MDLTAMLPRRRSPAEEAWRRVRAFGDAAMMQSRPRRGMPTPPLPTGMPRPGMATARRAGRRAALESWTATRAARALPLGTLAEAAWIAAGRPERRRFPRRAVLTAVALAGMGAGAMAIWMYAKRAKPEAGGGEGVEEAGRPATDEQALRDKPARLHTSPQEGHPAGTGERTDRDVGGPTSPRQASPGATGGAPGTPPGSGFEPHS